MTVSKNPIRSRIGFLVLCFILVTGVTYAVWNGVRQRAEANFRIMADDNLQALVVRMDRYRFSLDGLEAMFAAQDRVTRLMVVDYVEALGIESNLPGINGLGWIEPVARADVPAFLEEARRDGAVLDIHPETGADELFVIEFIEPYLGNEAAVGLDIAFETGRRTAARSARDTGTPQLTPRILLVQDETKQPGFLLLVPHYAKGALVGTEAERRAAFRGWVYAPFVGARTLQALTTSQDRLFDISVYDGEATDPGMLIYSSARDGRDAAARFRRSAQVPIYGRTWTVEWTSLPAFEAAQRSMLPWVTFAAALLISALFWRLLQVRISWERSVSRQVREQTALLTSRHSENLSIIENAIVGIVILDGEGRVLSSNHAARDLLAMRGGRIEGTFETILPELGQVRETGRITLLDPRGGARQVLDVHRNDWQTADGAARSTVLLRDVTDEEHANQQIAATEQRFDQALRGSEIGVFDVDLLSGKSVVTDTWLTLMGVDLPPPPDFDAQEYFMRYLHPDDKPMLLANDRACITGAAERSVSEFRLTLPGRGQRWMRSDAVVTSRDADGMALRLIGTQTDVTEIRRAQNALKSSEDRFRLSFQNAPVGKALVDADFNLVRVNAALCQFLGYPKSMLEDGCRLDRIFSEEDWAEFQSSLETARRSREITYRGEFELLNAGGEKVWGLVNANRAVDPQSGETIYIIQILDIGDAKRMEQMKTEFVATVSHELRTPLTSIKGAIGILRSSKTELEPDIRARLLDIAGANADRLTFLVNDILDLEKVRSGNMPFHIEPVDPASLLSDARDQIMPVAAAKQLRMKVGTVCRDRAIEVDPARCLQVMANLLSNACKFAPEEGVVQVSTEQVGAFLRIAVRDNGPGVPKSFEPRLFQPFSQADGSDTREKSGTGLGLSIVRELVERMGGEVGYRRTEDELTEFWFTCPLSDVRPAEPGQRLAG